MGRAIAGCDLNGSVKHMSSRLWLKTWGWMSTSYIWILGHISSWLQLHLTSHLWLHWTTECSSCTPWTYQRAQLCVSVHRSRWGVSWAIQRVVCHSANTMWFSGWSSWWRGVCSSFDLDWKVAHLKDSSWSWRWCACYLSEPQVSQGSRSTLWRACKLTYPWIAWSLSWYDLEVASLTSTSGSSCQIIRFFQQV